GSVIGQRCYRYDRQRGKVADLIQSLMVSTSPFAAICPMHPTLVREPFHRSGWVYERKEDGWRILAYKDGGGVRLVSRRGVAHTARFAEIASAVAKLRARRLILDGEVCVFDTQLVSQFHLLGDGTPEELATPPVFIAFDMLRAGERDLRAKPLAYRRPALEDAIAGSRFVL